MSEQSLASLKVMRTTGSSPPPAAPPMRGASPKAVNGNTEVRILPVIDVDMQALNVDMGITDNLEKSAEG